MCFPGLRRLGARGRRHTARRPRSWPALLTGANLMSDGDWLERLDDGPLSDAEQDLIRAATGEEWALAEGLAGAPEPVADPEAPAIASLLRLASGTDVVSLLRARLREMFAPPGESRRAMDRERRSCAFAELYRTSALPGLDAAAGE